MSVEAPMDSDEFILAPVRLFASEALLAGRAPHLLPPDAEVVDDLARAMDLENSQTPPAGYRIWRDVVNGAVGAFYAHPEARTAEQRIGAEADRVWALRGAFERALNIRRLRRTITPFEEFWLTVAYDVLESLRSVALGRAVLGADNPAVLEAIHAVFTAGFYPCGWREDGRIYAFAPHRLEGFAPLVADADGADRER